MRRFARLGGVVLFAERYCFSKKKSKIRQNTLNFVFRVVFSRQNAFDSFRRRPSPIDTDNLPVTASPGRELQK